MPPPSITIISNKSNQFGLQQDVKHLMEAIGGEVEHCDPLEYPKATDIAIHLEVPAYVWMSHAKKNILVVNPEWYLEDAWKSYLSRFDLIVTKDELAAKMFSGCASVRTIPWATSFEAGALPAADPAATREAFLWLVGGSKNKRAYAERLVVAWRPEYPPLLIASVEPLGLDEQSNITYRVGDLSPEERRNLLLTYKGHVCCSKAEGFGYTAAEAEAVGAFAILNELSCYKQDYGGNAGVAFLPSKLVSWFDESGVADIQGALDSAMVAFKAYDAAGVAARRASRRSRWAKFTDNWREAIEGLGAVGQLTQMPPILAPQECPPISVVTLIYNRRKFFNLAYHSILVNDYPKDRIEWILVDDSDDPMEQATDRIMEVVENAAPLKVVYVPLKKRTSVGEKRNIGVARATADIILMVDDDDHYPETSFRRRVAWLTKHPWAPKAVAATTIACYDLTRGISAVNVPPLDIPLGQRISEATLAFYKSWWAEKKFPVEVQVGEGENFLQGREADLLEIPPQQIIVAFSHGKNVSSRRVPSDADVKPGCFWGFPREFLEFIHGLV
jgi:hypothetical protein